MRAYKRKCFATSRKLSGDNFARCLSKNDFTRRGLAKARKRVWMGVTDGGYMSAQQPGRYATPGVIDCVSMRLTQGRVATRLSMHISIYSVPMSLIVTGTIGIDTVETRTGKAERVLGGSCAYFAAAASFLCPVRVVAAVGGDWPAEHRTILQHFKNIDLDGLES